MTYAAGAGLYAQSFQSLQRYVEAPACGNRRALAAMPDRWKSL